MRWLILALGLMASPTLAAAQSMGQPRGQAVSADLIRLHDDLHLSDTQETAWRDYTRAIAPSPQMQARHQATDGMLPLLPTPRRIALIEATMDQDTADFRRQGVAVTAFYNQLSPGQQRTFDLGTLPAPDGEGQDPGRPSPGAPQR
jgi:hypothetical protein